jgi:transposase
MNPTKPPKPEPSTIRRYYRPGDKERILSLHLLEGRAIPEICEAEGIHPTLFCQWRKPFAENGGADFEGGHSRSQLVSKAERMLAALEDKLHRKGEVIAEIVEDLVRTKKLLGALNGQWIPHDLHDTAVDFLEYHTALTGLPTLHGSYAGWLFVRASSAAGRGATPKSMNTTPCSPATTGSNCRSGPPSSTLPDATRWKAAAA